MSRTYDLACHDCKVAIWIGQASSGADRGHICMAEPYLTLINDFLWDHIGHSLEFCEDTKLDDYTEIEPD